MDTLPDSRRAALRGVWYVLGLTLLAGLYIATGYVGIRVAYFQSHVTLIWPPTGIAVAALFRFGYRYWPGVFVGALVVEAMALPVWVAAGIAVGNTLGPMIAVMLLRRVRFRPAIESQADVLRLVAAGSLLPMLVTATNGMAWMCWGELCPWSRYWIGWRVWWLGDAVGVLIFATPVLAFTAATWATIQERAGSLRLVGLLAATFALSLVCLGSLGDGTGNPFRLALVPALAALWAALRFGLWFGAMCLLVIAAVAVWDVSHGVGPFYHPNVHDSLVHLSGYLTGLTIILLMMMAVVSERDSATVRLAASEELYRTLVEGNPAMICRLGPGGEVTYVNETYTRATRQPAESAIGRLFFDGCAAEDRQRITEALTTLRGGTASVVLEMLAPGGRLRWHKWTLHATADMKGAVIGYQAVGLDVTDLRRAEEERRAIEDQMYHTQKLESLGVMAGGIAHDFNNLLTGIIGHAELASESGREVRGHLVQVLESARRAADLTRQLLAYAGKTSLVVRPLNLAAVVHDTIAIMGVSVPKRCTLRVEAGREGAWVNGDEVQLRQVALNLLINAGEAIGDRPGLIRIRTDIIDLVPGVFADSLTRSSVAAGRYARLRVSDTGCGINEATKAKIFEPFFTTKFTGRGLGLAAVHGIVRSHHGLVQVESTPGEGTEFTVLLPWHPDDTHALRETPPSVPTPVPLGHPPTPRVGMSVLVIDDEEAVLSVARELLENAGWDVRTASSGYDGLAAFHHEPDRYRVLVVDLTMPDLSGLEVMAKVRRVRADVPVILCTGFGVETIPDLTPLAPARPLTKPYGSAELVSAVAAMVGASGPATRSGLP